MKKQNILTIFLLLFGYLVFGQEKLNNIQLTSKEKEILNSKDRIVRESKKYIDSGNLICEGVVELVKVKEEIEFNQIGQWKHYYKDGSIRDIYIFDDEGYLMKYDSFEEDGFNFYSCKYHFKKVDGTNYRIEHLKIFYLTGGLLEDGFRYNKIDKIDGVVQRSSPRKIGIQTYYNEDGELIKQKVKRSRLAKKLGLLN